MRGLYRARAVLAARSRRPVMASDSNPARKISATPGKPVAPGTGGA
jgi:hypothetical protein